MQNRVRSVSYSFTCKQGCMNNSIKYNCGMLDKKKEVPTSRGTPFYCIVIFYLTSNAFLVRLYSPAWSLKK